MWLPEIRGPVDLPQPDHRALLLMQSHVSEREVLRNRFRTSAAMTAQIRDQGRTLGGRAPYGYRLVPGLRGHQIDRNPRADLGDRHLGGVGEFTGKCPRKPERARRGAGGATHRHRLDVSFSDRTGCAYPGLRTARSSRGMRLQPRRRRVRRTAAFRAADAGRGVSKSDETFAAQALAVFEEFGFQMIIAAPIRMSGIVEPFIGQAVLVEKRMMLDGAHSNAAYATFGELAARRDTELEGVIRAAA